ncbi:30S ribosomal protein S11 [Serratia plymuthica A30]|nr:30S ribosomal protein S11 [Serratia plymuthica A30]
MSMLLSTTPLLLLPIVRVMHWVGQLPVVLVSVVLVSQLRLQLRLQQNVVLTQ